MATTQQTGPRLTIAASCEGCAWLRSTPGFAHDCTHDDAGGGSTVLGPIPRKIGRHPTTPTWCPLLPAARLALARSVVAAAPCQVSLVRQIGGDLPCVVKGEHAEHRSACGRRWGGEDFADHPDFDSRAFCDGGEEQPK